MRVTANEKLTVFHNHVSVTLEAGSEATGSLAAMLLKRAPKKVTLIDEPAEGPQDPPPPSGHREPCVAGSVCGGEHCPPEEIPPGAMVPDANIPEILAWVGGDLDRAEIALHAEQAKDSPRATLIKQLIKLTTE